MLVLEKRELVSLEVKEKRKKEKGVFVEQESRGKEEHVCLENVGISKLNFHIVCRAVCIGKSNKC